MDRWRGKIGVVTGASSGIGEATVKDLLKHGVIVVGLARRIDRLKKNQSELPKNLQGNYHPIKCDVSNDNEVKEAFAWIEKNLGGVDILVNNAAVLKFTHLTQPDSSESLKQTVDINIMGIVYCTREAFKSMKNRDVPGHVILINSIAGHMIPQTNTPDFSVNIYSPTKYAVTAMTEVYRQEFRDQKTKVKVSSVSPGLVDTEIVPEQFKSESAILKPEDISDAIMYILGTPPHVQIHELTIKPLGEKA